jgi:cytochrome P450
MGRVPPLEDFADANYNPVIADALMFGDTTEDPYPFLRSVLEKGGPVQPIEFRTLMGLTPDMTLGDAPVFLVLGYDEVRAVLNDAELYSNDHFKRNLGLTFGNTLSAMNAPEHPRYRRIFQKAFLPYVVASWSDSFVDPVITRLIDGFAARGKADLMPEFVQPYPFEIIYRQLALPAGEEKIFHKLAIAQTQFMVDLAHGEEAGRKLGAYFQAMVDERRAEPGEDLVSVLATTEIDGERLPDDVVVSFLRQLINAAGDTTYRTTGNLLVAMLKERPDQFEMIRKDRSLIANAIEEALRWEGPVPMGFRTAMRDTELAGVRIPKGAVMQVYWGLTNRDPARFPDPDTYDLTRENSNRHMAFAAGPHICVGQHLARLEMTRAMNQLLDRFPNIRLDPDMPPPVIQGYTMRVPHHLHVLLD